jgi:hypothetical protein
MNRSFIIRNWLYYTLFSGDSAYTALNWVVPNDDMPTYRRAQSRCAVRALRIAVP